MRTSAQELTGIGLLINSLVIISFVVLVAKAFTPGTDQAPLTLVSEAATPTAIAGAATTAPTVVPTSVPATTAPTATALPATETREPTPAVATATVTSTVATGGASEAAGAASPDIDVVAAIVTKGTCNACHTIPGIAGAVGIVGPNLSNIGAEAGTRIPGYTAEQYLHESIVDPNAFVAPKCPFGACVPGTMPNTLAQTLTPEEVQLMVTYLLTLQSPQ